MCTWGTLYYHKVVVFLLRDCVLTVNYFCWDHTYLTHLPIPISCTRLPIPFTCSSAFILLCRLHGRIFQWCQRVLRHSPAVYRGLDSHCLVWMFPTKVMTQLAIILLSKLHVFVAFQDLDSTLNACFSTCYSMEYYMIKTAKTFLIKTAKTLLKHTDQIVR